MGLFSVCMCVLKKWDINGTFQNACPFGPIIHSVTSSYTSVSHHHLCKRLLVLLVPFYQLLLLFKGFGLCVCVCVCVCVCTYTYIEARALIEEKDIYIYEYI